VDNIYDATGRVEFNTPAKVILIIGASLSGFGLLSSLFYMQFVSIIFCVVTLSCQLWLLIKRVRLPYYIMIVSYAISHGYNIISSANVLAQVQESYTDMGLNTALVDSLFTIGFYIGIAIGILFAAGFLILIFVLIRKQWKYMPLYSGTTKQQ